MEIVDIVDKNNRVIGKMSKKKAHKIGALHRTVIAALENSKGELILIRQASDKQDAGQLVNPVGGHVRAGESAIEALRREAKEEIGISGFKFKYLGEKIFNRKVIGRKENHFFMVYKIFSDKKLKHNHEGIGFE